MALDGCGVAESIRVVVWLKSPQTIVVTFVTRKAFCLQAFEQYRRGRPVVGWVIGAPQC